MLKVNNLNAFYGKKNILRGLSFEAEKGDIISVVGESGTGKTTLALSLMGMLPSQSADARVSGQILFGGMDICRANQQQLRQIRWKKISMVFQNVDNILNPSMSIYQQIGEVLDGKDNRGKIKGMLETVGFPLQRLDAYPHQLSMGEKQKALVAMAYILDPELVILDEPTSSLDQEAKDSLIEVIKRLSLGKTVLLVTHDLDTAGKLARKSMVLYGGSIIEFGPTKDLFSFPRHPYTRGLVRSYPSLERTKDLQGIRGKPEFVNAGCPFWPRCTQSIEVCRISKPPLLGKGDLKVACHRGGIIPLLKVENISKSYRGLKVLQSVGLKVYEGETVTLLGKSGSGKTTLAKIIMGLLRADSGRVYLENKKVERWDAGFYSRVQMIFQDVRSAVSHRLNVVEAVTEPLLVQAKADRKKMAEEVKKVLAEVELPTDEQFLHSYPHHLSGGELQRVVIARALVLSPKLIIADEPTSSLDASIQAKVLKLLNRIQEERGLGMLFITHDLGVARKVSDRILRLERGFAIKGKAALNG
ncbi:MAG: ABC transporter ATP-binding protein [Actinomycetota bacterium]